MPRVSRQHDRLPTGAWSPRALRVAKTDREEPLSNAQLAELLAAHLDPEDAPSQWTIATWARQGSLGPTLASQARALAAVLGRKPSYFYSDCP